jgi:hypothetical protein
MINREGGGGGGGNTTTKHLGGRFFVTKKNSYSIDQSPIALNGLDRGDF